MNFPWNLSYTWGYRQSSQWRHNECGGVSNYQPRDCLLNSLLRRRSKKTSKLRVTGPCEGNSPVTSELPAQRVSNAENVSIWWRHHEWFFVINNLLPWPFPRFLWTSLHISHSECSRGMAHLECEVDRTTLRQWGWVTHIRVSEQTIIGPDIGLSPGRCKAITWTSAGILFIRTLGTNFSEILSEIHTFFFQKMRLKMSFGKWRHFNLGLSVLTHYRLMMRHRSGST